MKTYKHLYDRVTSFDNLILAWNKARKGKTKKQDVTDFEKSIDKNLHVLQQELIRRTYKPRPLKVFILRDPKTRKICKSDFRDRVVHHALCNILEPIFEKIFIQDCCANRKRKGALFALQRFDLFKRKVTKNGRKNLFSIKNNKNVGGYCLKADIKHYFDDVNHVVLQKILSRKIKDQNTLILINLIITNALSKGKGMPLGNLTSQFFANVYLNELDYFVKHHLRAKYYIRYVDDFVLLHESKEQLVKWAVAIEQFLKEKLKLELHPQKTRIIPLARGVDFVGFRNFYHYRLLRKRNIRKMNQKIEAFKEGNISPEQIQESFQGWQAYARWANTYRLREEIKKKIVYSRQKSD